MSVRLKKLKDQVMVITGASSGIGLKTARLAASRGVRLVLAARNEQALQELTDEIRRGGGEAIYAVADVGNEADVSGIARAALQHFGGFDTWVNDAGVGIYGKLLDVSVEDMRRLFETDFWGVVYGSLEAARHLREAKGNYGGAIINVGSEVSERAVPLIGMYSAAKHAVKGFTDALRMELEKEKFPISVTLVRPSAIDTPFPQHAKNYLEVEPTLPTPMYAPEVVAKAILHCAENPRRDIFAGGAARMHSLEETFLPRVFDWLMEAVLFSKQKSSRPPRHAEEALHGPTTGLRERGDSRGHVRESSLYTNAALHPLWTAALAAGAGLAATALLSKAAAGQRR